MDILKAAEISGRCYNQEDGAKLFTALAARLRKREKIAVSFEGVDTVPSSFVNAAFIVLLEEFSFEVIKASIQFIKTTRQINEMIRSRFAYETTHRKAGDGS